LLYWALEGDLHGLQAQRAEQIHSSDLAARLWHHERVAVTTQVIDTCRSIGANVALLKGVSVATKYWPVPHARPMSDIDILVEPLFRGAVENELRRRGFQPMPGYESGPGDKHGPPLAHPERGIWVEVHSSLIDNIAADAPLGPDHVSRHLVESDYEGRRVYRLSAELQIVYTAYAWMSDISRYVLEIQPSGLPPMFDVLFLCAAEAPHLDAHRFIDRPENAFATASTYLLLSYIERSIPELVPADILRRAQSAQDLIDTVQLRIMHRTLTRFLFGGRPWHKLYPLPVPGRYSLRHQIRKRLFRLRWNKRT